ncbi:hypothetical protein VTO42DRAFT_46 [Malbranchea cinnamomea]
MREGKKLYGSDRDESWHSKGHDYGANFTINICAPVVERLEDVVGVDKALWKNVSAYYEQDGKVYSIGQESSSLVFRGRKLVLNYTDGSPCPSLDEVSRKRKLLDDDDDDDDDDVGDHDEDDTTEKDDGDKGNKIRRKSTIMSFLCDRDLISPAAAISFVGSIDSCSYFFEVRSIAACGGVAASSDGGVGPAGVFGIIVGIAVAAYLIGGCAYQRTVMHQRGWRQCPNYNLWAGMASFFKDMAIIIFSSMCSCLRLDRLKSPRVYSILPHGQGSGGPDGGRRGIVGAIGGRGTSNRQRRPDVDEENRLIDQLDEEWED